MASWLARAFLLLVICLETELSAAWIVLAMACTARITNIDGAVNEEELVEHFRSKGLSAASGQTRISLIAGSDGVKTATLTFSSEVVLQKAMKLPAEDRLLRGKQIYMDTSFSGLTVLAEGSEIDIVALHGLNGHAFATWEHPDRDDQFMWLRDCLNEHHPGARVLSYGYNANVLSDVSTGRLRTFAETFLEKLRLERDTEERRDKPLVIMSHSLGGLVVKQALILANTRRTDGRYLDILDSVRSIMFFGTPHRGGNGVNTAVFVTNLLRAINMDPRTDLIKSLDPRSMSLFDLTDDFRQIVESLGIIVHTFFEGKKTKIGRFPSVRRVLIVEEQSAILGTARERKSAVDADHSHICKFKSPADEAYVTVRNALNEVITTITPVVATRDWSIQPEAPPDLKYVNLTDPGKLEFDFKHYPVLEWGGYTYWALSYVDNRHGMAILAYDNKGRIAGRWEKTGARYVCAIKVEKGRVEFVGQAGTSVTLALKELRVDLQ